MDEERFRELVELYLDGRISEAEAEELHEALESSPELTERMLSEASMATLLSGYPEYRTKDVAQSVRAALRDEAEKARMIERVVDDLPGPTPPEASRRSGFLEGSARPNGRGVRGVPSARSPRRRRALKGRRRNGRRPKRSRRALLRYALLPLGAAAAVLILFSYYANVRQVDRAPGELCAEIVEIRGRVDLTGASGVTQARRGDILEPGRGVGTGPGAEVKLLYPDGTTLDLAEKSALSLERHAKAKRLSLARGRVYAEVPRQPAAWPMAVSTVHAEARVLGTRFTLSAELEATRLEVLEGRVRLTRLGDGVSVEVAGGYIAMVSRGVDLAARRADVMIPRQSDWTYRGVVLKKGAPGSWDVRLEGMITPCTVVKKGGTYFLYYLGADGNRSTDGGPRHRALGVATSADGLRFTKYEGNPIITHLPHRNQEEGVFSAGSVSDEAGNVRLCYGALWAEDPTTESVNSDARVAVSSDGLHFTDRGMVLSHGDTSLWGHGDGIFPTGVLRAEGRWCVYYIADGGEASWDLGLAWGPSLEDLSDTKAVLTSGSRIIGGCEPVRIGPDRIALFIVRDLGGPAVEVRTASASAPDRLSDPAEVYDFGDFRHLTVFLDDEAGTWFMYYLTRAGDAIGVKTAPVRGRAAASGLLDRGSRPRETP